MSIIQLEIEKVIYGGDGLGFHKGKIHFIPGVLPGELVEVEITEEKRGFNRCRLISIIRESEYREIPICPIYDRCGGCNFQHTNYEHQLDIKKEIIRDIFSRTGKITLEEFELYPSNPLQYRNRVQVHHQSGVKGFKSKGSNSIVEVTHCPVLVDSLNSYFSETCNSGIDREIVFSNGEEIFTGSSDNECNVDICEKTITFNPSSFFQSNIEMIPTLLNLVNSSIKGSVVMDLYCGSGLFSAFLPESVEKIIAVEMDKRVEPFYIKNVGNREFNFYPLTLERYLKRGLHKKHVADTVIIDPPRKGLSKEVISFLLTLKATRIIYVSCDPVTMARDIKMLTEKQYTLTTFSALDFYPQTHHIESFGVLDLV